MDIGISVSALLPMPLNIYNCQIPYDLLEYLRIFINISNSLDTEDGILLVNKDVFV